MKITQLKLENFRSFVEVGLNLNAPRVFIAGVNGAGKSTVREAIKWALTGRCQGLDGKGSGADKLVPTTNQQAHTVDVTATLQDIIDVRRSWSPGGAVLEVEGMSGSTTEQQKALCDEILKVANPAYLDAALDSDVFLHLHHADAKSLILQLLKVMVPIEDKSYTLDELDREHDKAFKDRKSSKDKVKGAFVPALPTSAEPTLNGKTLADKDAHMTGVAGLLKTLRDQVNEMNQKVGGTIAQRKDLQRRLDQLKQPVPPPNVMSSAEALEALDVAIHDLEERLAIMEDQVVEQTPAPFRPAAGPTLNFDEERKRAKVLREFDPKNGCVLDGKLKCPAQKVTFFSRARDIEDALEKLAPQPVVEQTPMPAVANPKTPLVAQLSDLKVKRASVSLYLEAVQTYTVNAQELRKELDALPDMAADQQAIDALQTRIARGEQIEKAGASFFAQLQAYKDAQEHRTALEADVTRLEALVEVLGPRGARVQALAKALEPFEATVNAFLHPFQWVVSFQVEPWTVFVNGRSVDTYSRSEQHRIGIALQLAIAQMSGLGFAIVDELDMMTGTNRELLGRMLFSAKLDQVIVLSSREPDVALPDAARIPGMIAVRLGNQNGRSVVLEVAGEGAAA